MQGNSALSMRPNSLCQRHYGANFLVRRICWLPGRRGSGLRPRSGVSHSEHHPMVLVLNSAQQAQFAAVARALLSPLDLANIDHWRADVLQRLAPLVEADYAGFLLPVPGSKPYTLWNLPDDFGREFLEQEGGVEAFAPMIRQLGSRVWNTRLLGAAMGLRMPEGWFGSDQYLRFYGRYGIQEGLGFAALEAADPEATAPVARPGDGACAGALLTCFRAEYGTEAFGERGLALLRMLLPALEAGVTTRLRLAGAAAAFEAALDATSVGAMIVSVDGRRLYANPALSELLAKDPERARIRAEMDRAAAELRFLLRARAAHRGVPSLAGANTELRTAHARYRVWTTLLGEHLASGGPAVLVQIERLTPEPPSLPALRERWGLTRQEARVARLLARGRTNRQIAAALGIRETTARHYTEAVFQKLGVHSRAEAAARILGG